MKGTQTSNGPHPVSGCQTEVQVAPESVETSTLHQRDDVGEPRISPLSHTLSIPNVLAANVQPLCPDSVLCGAKPRSDQALPLPVPAANDPNVRTEASSA